jgi:hypothetical protein
MTSSKQDQREKRGLFVVSLVVLSAFGPYIGTGIRTEQVVVFSLGVILLTLTLQLMRPEPALIVVMAFWTVYVGVAAVGGIEPVFNSTPWERNSLLAGLDNVLLPIAVVLIVLGLCALGANPRLLLDRVALVVVLVMAVNVALAIAALNFGWGYPAFWSSEADGRSTALNALDNGRSSGLLNQPAEGGLMYGLALLCAIYLWGDRTKRLLLVSAVLIIGGVLTVSKVFLFCAAPIALWQLLRISKRRGERTGIFLVAGGLVIVAAAAGALPELPGTGQFRQLIPKLGGSWLSSLTASRLGETSTLGPVIDQVQASAPFFGFGAAGLKVPYDSGFIEALIIAGFTGVVVYMLTLTAMWRGRLRMKGRLRWLYVSIVLLLVGGSVGIPALTVNRCSTIVWLVITLLLMIPRDEPKRKDQTVGGANRSPVTLRYR